MSNCYRERKKKRPKKNLVLCLFHLSLKFLFVSTNLPETLDSSLVKNWNVFVVLVLLSRECSAVFLEPLWLNSALENEPKTVKVWAEKLNNELKSGY